MVDVKSVDTRSRKKRPDSCGTPFSGIEGRYHGSSVHVCEVLSTDILSVVVSHFWRLPTTQSPVLRFWIPSDQVYSGRRSHLIVKVPSTRGVLTSEYIILLTVQRLWSLSTENHWFVLGPYLGYRFQPESWYSCPHTHRRKSRPRLYLHVVSSDVKT